MPHEYDIVPIPQNRAAREGASQAERLHWFREARFGLFIHWGLYAIPAGIWKGEETAGIGEWLMHRFQIPVAEYEPLAQQFNPVKFNVREWVSLAKAAGQKYITITAKHHDGFCLFKSAVTNYNVVDATPFGRDVCKELADECARQGLTMCFYYSQDQDWHHPGGYGNTWDYTYDLDAFIDYVDHYVKPQVTELLTNYGPIGLIWFDTPYSIPEQQSEELAELVHRLQPNCLVSGRVGNAKGDYASAGDNLIPEAMVGGDFETPATINDTWGYKVNDHNWKSAEDMLHKLVDIVSKNGNYLLNVGPTAEGVIPPESVERLLAMGDWLRVNGESIYGCGAGPLQNAEGLRTTQKGDVVYLHIFNLPADGVVKLPLAAKVKEASLLMNGAAVGFKQRCGRLTLQLPAVELDPVDTVVRLVTG
ncbi:MAG: alpha-L-fucosidase [Anaerolineae bacterium]|nr:alpha-L-fucosidase [Anaerolineae bacterium]